MNKEHNLKTNVFHILGWLLLFYTLSACQKQGGKDLNIEIRYFGALKEIMAGDLESRFDLLDLKNKNNIYALGAGKDLKGEIQVFNSRSSYSSARASGIEIDSTFNHKASLLIYARVPEWDSFSISGFSSLAQLEDEIFTIAESKGIDINEPFPFLLEGRPESLEWHVINWDENDKVHTHDKHKASGLSGQLNDELIQVLGFFSRNHKGVFTHHTRDSHMHFRTFDGKMAGHLDEISTSDNLYLKLPKK